MTQNWKTRSVSYEDLRKAIAESPTESQLFSDFAEFLAKMTSDSNASALDSGLETATVFAEHCPKGFMGPFSDKLVSNAIDKAFGTRPATQ